MDSASDSGSEGWRFESFLACQETRLKVVRLWAFFFAKRKPLAELVERKSLRLWTKIKLLVKVKLGLPTNKTRNKEDLIVDKDISSLEHTRWRCQYHVVFAPKYRRLAIYGELKQDIGYILRKLCERKGIEIIDWASEISLRSRRLM